MMTSTVRRTISISRRHAVPLLAVPLFAVPLHAVPLLAVTLLAVTVLGCFSEAPNVADDDDASTTGPGTQGDPTVDAGESGTGTANADATSDAETDAVTGEATSDPDSSTGDPIPSDCEPALPGLVAWWSFDADFGDAFGNVEPQPEPGAILADEGRHGGGAGFDGLGGALATDAMAPVFPDATAFTIEAWVQLDDVIPPDASAGTVADFSVVSQMASDGGVPNADGWRLLMYTDTSWWFCLGNRDNGCNPDGAEPNVVRSGTVSAPGAWIHLVAMRDGDELRLYVDGEIRDAQPVDQPSVEEPAPLVIGATTGENSGLLDAFFFGRIDDVSVYDRALDGDEVLGLAQATMPRCALEAEAAG